MPQQQHSSSGASHRAALTRPHLSAAFASLCLVGALFVGVRTWAHRILQLSAASYASDQRPVRVRGLALNENALRNDSLLPVFGSSELSVDIAHRADRFFNSFPPGHAMFVMAGGGVVLMNHVIEAGAFARSLRDRWVMVFVASPEIAMAQERRARFFAGNFSRAQAASLFDDATLTDTLRREVASLLLRYPTALAIDPVVAETARLARQDASLGERAMAALLRPALAMDAAWLRAADLVRSAADKARQAAPRSLVAGEAHSLGADSSAWDSVTRVAHADWHARSSSNPYGFTDDMWAKLRAREAHGERLQFGERFAEQLENPIPWEELDVLLRAMQSAHAHPLVVCLPTAGAYLDATGASPAVRAAFYEKLRAVTQRARVPLVEFSAHDMSPGLLDGLENHLTPEGWMLVNRTLAPYVSAFSR